MTDRKLATIRRISALTPIPDADKIETATVDGWKVVCQKGLYNVNDLCVYLEIDSWVPHEIAPFLTKPGHEPKLYKSVLGERLRTTKLKKQISQGLLLPLSEIPRRSTGYEFTITEGEDLTEFLDIIKWEKEIPSQLSGMMKGDFPSFLVKTDQERIQNIPDCISHWAKTFEHWEVTEKLNGSSMTVYLKDDIFGICSRNIELKLEDTSNAFVKTAQELVIEAKLQALNLNIALQGELIGPGIQGNPYQRIKPEFYIFDIYDINTQTYLNHEERIYITKRLGLSHVPILSTPQIYGHTVESFLTLADGKSRLADVPREGLVYKHLEKPLSFKVISNSWLLKNE